MPLLTVIIPFLKDDTTELFEETLASFLENRTEGVEILILNSVNYEDMYGIQNEEGVRFLKVDPEISYLEAVNRGMEESDSEFVHPVLCGAVAKNDWITPALKRFENPAVSAVIPVLIEEKEESEEPFRRIHSGFVYERSGKVFPYSPKTNMKKWSRLAPHYAGAFYRRSVIRDLHFFNTSLEEIFAFVDMSLMISSLGDRTVLETHSRLYEPFDRFQDREVDPLLWKEEQEILYSHWRHWGGSLGTGILHRCRLWVEYIKAVCSGNGRAVLFAYSKGKRKEAAEERLSFLNNLKTLRKSRLQKSKDSI
ncbi:MAG: hypothetical protein Q4G69_00025 [Planctomycetia bacterium]|nr:hypothetical protein [Planctomycetia bacterium]